MSGLYIYLFAIPQLLIAKSSFWLAKSPKTMLDEDKVANGNVYIKNCGIDNETISIMVEKSMFFKRIFCTNRRMELTKKIQKKNMKATMKF